MIEAELHRIERRRGDATHAMNAGCTDYACYCHFEIPGLIAEVRRMRAAANEALAQIRKTCAYQESNDAILNAYSQIETIL